MPVRIYHVTDSGTEVSAPTPSVDVPRAIRRFIDRPGAVASIHIERESPGGYVYHTLYEDPTVTTLSDVYRVLAMPGHMTLTTVCRHRSVVVNARTKRAYALLALSHTVRCADGAE
jgi:hypothetical protein